MIGGLGDSTMWMGVPVPEVCLKIRLDGVCTEDERLANKLEPVRGADLDSLARQANHIHR